MGNVREILVTWTTIAGGGRVSVFNFNGTSGAAGQRTALQAWLTSWMGAVDNSCSYVIAGSGVELDEDTGGLIGSWSETSSKVGTGATTTEPAADSTQGLARWVTGTIYGGRFVKGRTYIPSIDRGQIINGNFAAASVASLTTAGNTLAASATGFSVWSRPQKDVDGNIVRNGRLAPVTGGQVWTEFAVLRRRRS